MSERVCKGCGGPLPTLHPNRRYCSDNCRKRRWDREEYRGICEVCGTLTWAQARLCGVHSLEAIKAKAEPHREAIMAMWAAGATIREIAAALGWTVNHTRAEIGRMRRYGYELPHRRTPEQCARIRETRWGRAAA